MRFFSLVAVAAVAAPFAFAGDVVNEPREASTKFVRPDGVPESDLHGGCSILDSAERQKLNIWAEGVPADMVLRLWMGDGHETMTDLGVMAKSGAARFYQRNTGDGGELPFGVDGVRALAERRIEIRDGEGHVLLKGNVPVIRDDVPPPPPPVETLSAKASFVRTDDSGDHEYKGVVAVMRKGDRSAIRMEFGRLESERAYMLYIGSGDSMTVFDDLRANHEGGASIGRDTGAGQSLPLGATDVAQLAGKRIELRDLDGHVLLHAEIPSVESHEDVRPVHEKEHHEDETSGTNVKVIVDIRPDKGHEELKIVVKDIPRDGDGKDPAKRGAPRTLTVLMDDGTGTLQPVELVRIRGREARVRYLTRRGDALPFGAATLRALAGRGFELRVGGLSIASGNLPQY